MEVGSSSQGYLEGLEGSSCSLFWENFLRSWCLGGLFCRNRKGKGSKAKQTAWAKAPKRKEGVGLCLPHQNVVWCRAQF